MDISEKFASDVVVTLGSAVRVLEDQHHLLFHINHQVEDTLKIAQALAKAPVPKKPSLVLPVLIGVGIGIYLSKRAAKATENKTWQESAEEFKQKAQDIADKVTVEKNNDTRPGAQFS